MATSRSELGVAWRDRPRPFRQRRSGRRFQRDLRGCRRPVTRARILSDVERALRAASQDARPRTEFLRMRDLTYSGRCRRFSALRPELYSSVWAWLSQRWHGWRATLPAEVDMLPQVEDLAHDTAACRSRRVPRSARAVTEAGRAVTTCAGPSTCRTSARDAEVPAGVGHAPVRSGGELQQSIAPGALPGLFGFGHRVSTLAAAAVGEESSTCYTCPRISQNEFGGAARI